MALFIPGTENKLFTTLGIPYGFIFCENMRGVANAFTMDNLCQALEVAVKEKAMIDDEAHDLELQAQVFGLLPDIAAIFAKAADFKLPEDFKPEVEIAIKDMPDTLIPLALIIKDTEGKKICVALIKTKHEALSDLTELVVIGKMKPFDAIYGMQKILASNIPLDDIEWQKMLHLRLKVCLKKLNEEKRPEMQMGMLKLLEVMLDA